MESDEWTPCIVVSLPESPPLSQLHLYEPIISQSLAGWNPINSMSDSQPNLIINTFEESVLHQYLNGCVTIS